MAKDIADIEYERQRADKPLFYDRVRTVQEWLLIGKPVSDIIMNIAQNWNIGERQAHRYIREARKLFIEQNKAKSDEKLAFHISVRTSLYAKALHDKDIKTALAIMKDTAELEGLYTKKLEVFGNKDKPVPFQLILKVNDDEEEGEGDDTE